MVVNAGKRTDLLGDHAGGTFGDIHLDVHDVGAVPSVVGGLIDADRKPARDRRNYFATSVNDEGSGDVFIADEADEGTTPPIVVRQNAETAFASARQPVRPIVDFAVGVKGLAAVGDR